MSDTSPKRFSSTLGLLLFVASAAVLAQAHQGARPAPGLAPAGKPAPADAVAPEYGPAKGTLVIVGGGSLEGTGIVEKFIELAGGTDAKLVVVPTAGGNKNADGTIRVYREEQVIASWLKRGMKNVTMLHTHDPKVADTEEFVKAVREANAVWFDGGRQWNIVDSYMNTLTYREFHKVLERGGVIGGSSAGATIQGDYLVRGAIAGSEIVMTPEPEHEHGFNFLRRSAIDQHINARNRWDDIIPVIRKIPEPARHRPVRGHGDHREGRPVRGDGEVEGGGARQHEALPALGEAVLRAGGRRHVRHEGPEDREVRNGGRAAGAQGRGTGEWELRMENGEWRMENGPVRPRHPADQALRGPTCRRPRR